MFHRLHQRSSTPDQRGYGLSCDETGLYFGGDCALVTCAEVEGRRIYLPRPMEDINRALSAGYGAMVDLGGHQTALDRVAEHLTKSEWGLAQITALQMRLPDLPDDAAVERLLKADQLLRFNPNHDERGRFASAPSGGDGETVVVTAPRKEPPPLLAPSKGGQLARDAARAANEILSKPNSAAKFTIPETKNKKGEIERPRMDVELKRDSGRGVSVTVHVSVFSIEGHGKLEPLSGKREASVSNIKWKSGWPIQLTSAPKSLTILQTKSGEVAYEFQPSLDGSAFGRNFSSPAGRHGFDE
jgi:hypothetical protein